MPVVATAKPDGPKIRQLISERGYSVTDFARKIGRARQSIWNIAGYELPVSVTFLRQIASGLGVKVSEISDWTGDDDIVSGPETADALSA